MNRGAGDLDAAAQGFFMHAQAVVAFSAERRNQGGVHVQNPVRPFGGKAFAENAHEARENDEIDPVLLQQNTKLLFKGRPLPHGGFHAGFGRAFQRVGFGIVGNDQNDLAAVENAALLRVQKGLKIGAAAGDQHGDPCFFLHRPLLMRS